MEKKEEKKVHISYPLQTEIKITGTKIAKDGEDVLPLEERGRKWEREKV